MRINGVQCSFHHLGIPITEIRQDERYSPLFDMYTSDSPCESMRVQWHRFGPASPFHPVVRSQPHVAFKVDDLERAITGKPLLLGKRLVKAVFKRRVREIILEETAERTVDQDGSERQRSR